MGKTRDLFKKIRDTKGIFHAKMGSIKDRNGMDLTEAEELYKKDLHNPIITMVWSWFQWFVSRTENNFPSVVLPLETRKELLFIIHNF